MRVIVLMDYFIITVSFSNIEAFRHAYYEVRKYISLYNISKLTNLHQNVGLVMYTRIFIISEVAYFLLVCILYSYRTVDIVNLHRLGNRGKIYIQFLQSCTYLCMYIMLTTITKKYITYN